MVKRTYILLCFAVALVFFGCKKPKDIGVVPLIELVSISPMEVEEFRDSVIVTIRILDGNGDIGTQDPDDNTVVVQDQRYENPDYYHLPPFTPEGTEVKVEGTVNIFIPTLVRISEREDREQTRIDIKLVDRAGNWSNTLTTPPITINAYQGE